MIGRSLIVADCVGPTFQGEGPSAGQLAVVIRLSTDPSVPGPDESYDRFGPAHVRRRFEVDTLVDWVLGAPARLVVVTGGEPLAQPDGLIALTDRLVGLGYRVEIETGGTVAPPAELLAAKPWFVVSPRLRDRRASRADDAALAAFARCDRAAFCVVIRAPDDIVELLELEQRHGLHPIWVVPQGVCAGQVLAGMRWLADQALEHGWHLSGGCARLATRA